MNSSTEADRIAIVTTIRGQMKEWRLGMRTLPELYIVLHEECARADVARFTQGQGARIHNTEMVSDGWAVGMRVLRVIAEVDGRLKDYRWSTSNGGSWFEVYPSGGQGLVEKSPMGPGHL